MAVRGADFLPVTLLVEADRVTGGAKFSETFGNAGWIGARHEGLRSTRASELKLIHWQTGEPVVSLQPSFSFTSK